MKRRWIRRLVFFIALVVVAAALRLTIFRSDPIPVTVFRAERGRVEETVANSKAGTVQSRRRASLSPEVGGRVDAILVKKGERVRTGQVLLRLAKADSAAQLALQERAIDVARASEREACRAASLAEADLARYASLARQQIVSQEVLDQVQSRRDVAVAACDASRSRVQQAIEAVRLARVTLDKTDLRAPFAGVIAEITTENGEWITPSPPGLPIPPVLEMFDADSLYLSAPMDEVDVGKIRPQQPVRITMDAYPGRAFEGHVVRVAPYVQDIQQQNRTFEIEAEFDDAAFARTLLPGTSADVEVILEARDGVLRIPTPALLEGNKVLVARGERLEAASVEPGLRNWDFVEIRGGLQVGDPVVVSLDRAEVKEGARFGIAGETRK
jgi:HlyD family secretion protein